MRGAQGRGRRRWRAAVLVVVGLRAMVVAAPADAHAVVSGTDPEDGARLALAPGRVTVFVDAKLPTLEGDPLQVYGPDGGRVDAGDARVVEDRGADAAGAAALSVGLRPDIAHLDGDYHVVYRVISADTHLVAGQFTFHCGRRSAVSPVRTLDAEPVAMQTPSPAVPLAHGWSADRWHWPKAASVAGVVLAMLGARTRRRHHGPAPPIPWSAGMAGLVAGHRLD